MAETGKHLSARPNALVAYTLFQGWGNDPAQYAKGKGKQLLDTIEDLMPAAGQAPATKPANDLDVILGLAGTAPAIDWHYTVDGPVHRVAVLDTRTRRTFPGRVSPPNLLGDTLGKQVPKAPLDAGIELLVVVAAAPILGPVLIDQIGQPLRIVAEEFKIYVLRTLLGQEKDPCEPEDLIQGFEAFDAEGWARNEDGLETMLKRLSEHSRVVVLSGDVHYGMSLVLDYWKKGQTASASSRIVQLTSSGTRNVFKPLIENLIRAAAVGQRAEAVGLPAIRFAWEDNAQDTLAFPTGSSVRPGVRARLNRDPVLVPGKGWPNGTTVTTEPDYRWRLDLIRDSRTDAERPASLAPPGTLTADFNEADPIDSYFDVAARHAQAASEHYYHLRQIVFPNNIGVVRFPSNAGGDHVRHELVSGDPSDPRRPTRDFPNTVHEVSLDPVAEGPPDLETNDSEEPGDG
jgi:hypothetical protein